MNFTSVFVLQALNHNRRSIDMSRHRPRWMSSIETAIIMPALSNGTLCSRAYAVANRQPSWASLSFSEKGGHGCRCGGRHCCARWFLRQGARAVQGQGDGSTRSGAGTIIPWQSRIRRYRRRRLRHRTFSWVLVLCALNRTEYIPMRNL